MTYPESHWNYRVVKHSERHEKFNNGEEIISYHIHSTHYEHDVPITISTEPSVPYGETPEELLADIELMKKAFDKPILNYSDF